MIIINKVRGCFVIPCIKNLKTRSKLSAVSLWLLIALTTFALAGCGSAEGISGARGMDGGVGSGQGEASQEEAKKDGSGDITGFPEHIEAAAIADAAEGLDLLSEAVKSFKTAVENDERDQAAQLADEMVSLWKSIAADTAEKDAKRHDQLEGDLLRLLGEVAKSDWDKTRLIDLDYSLYQGVRDLKQLLN